jgi:hypothetical protein
MLSRRTAGQLAFAAAVAGSSAHAKTNNGPFDLNDPWERLLAYIKVRANLDGSPAYYHYHADYFGIPDGGAAQLCFKREGVSVHKMVAYDNKTVGLRYSETNYVLDVNGKPSDTIVNPYTGATVTPKAQAPGPGLKVIISPNGDIDTGLKLTPPSSSKMLFLPPISTAGDRIWFTDDILLFRTAGDPSGFQLSTPRPGDNQLTEVITFEASIKDVQNPKLTSTPATAVIGAVVPWTPWLQMKTPDGKDISGRMLLRYRCAKLKSPDELPQWLSTRINQDHAGFLTNPKLEL